MNFFKSELIFASIIFFSSQCAVNQEYTIEKYNHERDEQAVIKMLNDTPQYLRYETLGMPAGTTEKYITSPTYTTEVIRVNGKTIGFINYLAYNLDIFTFHIMRFGFINLMSIDKEYQGVGYGKILFAYAVDQLIKLKCPTIMLNAKLSNTKARNMYEKAGFSPRIAGDDVLYTLKTNVLPSELPQGNIIQRHPYASLMIAACLGATYFAWTDLKKQILRLMGTV